ncbi:MAG: DUF167 domain-containing protein [Burkholderiaceae bacterium]|nr:DUF167 domain-containing protein [Burkholderiaceae bacterium]
MPTASYLHPQPGGDVLLDVHVVPNAPRTQPDGTHDGALRLRLKALPVEGRANDALVAWVAQALDIPRPAVTLVRGHTARRKHLRIAAAHAAQADWKALGGG